MTRRAFEASRLRARAAGPSTGPSAPTAHRAGGRVRFQCIVCHIIDLLSKLILEYHV